MLKKWGGSALDVVQVVSVPVASAQQQAVVSMDHVKSIRGTQKEEKHNKAPIFTILSLLLAVVPFVAEFGASFAGLVAFGRAIALAWLAG